MTDLIVLGDERLRLAIRLPGFGMPEIVTFGQADPGATSTLASVERSSRINGMDVAVPSAVLLPTGGMGFFGWPAISGHRKGRDFVLQFGDWEVTQNDGGAVLTGHDRVAAIDLEIDIRTHAGGVLSMASRVRNVGGSDYQLDRCAAGSFLIDEGEVALQSFTGMWGREFQTRTEPLGNGVWLQENRRGRTSHDRFPVIFVESQRNAFGLALGWSGNHQIAIDRLDDGRRLAHLGELFEPGEMLLAPGQVYESPRAYAGADPAAFHAFLREELLPWPGGVMRPRPVTLNTWEGNYFDHKIPSLMEQATEAAALGVERFVIDDGWFGRRDDDTTSLGDWDIDPRKYPDGLSPLVEHVTGLGMEFGIWFEPEMVNPVSSLFDAHPDWALQIEGRPLLLSRNQLMLDLSRADVADYLFDKVDAVLANHAISYIKWDMNRDLTHVGGREGRAMTSVQTRAVYALMARVRAAHPDVEIESCASGGGRVDLGVLAHTHRVWASDCTDALERLEIQRGVSRLLPPEIIGSHVSASPNHQTGRRHSLSFRALVAMAYHFGIELNPVEMSGDERTELKRYVETHKRLRSLFHAPGASFNLPPSDGRYVWGAASPEAIAVIIAQGPQMVAEQPAPVRLPDLGPDDGRRWRIARVLPERPQFIRMSTSQEQMLSGQIDFTLSEASSIGLPLPMLTPESALLIELEPSEE